MKGGGRLSPIGFASRCKRDNFLLKTRLLQDFMRSTSARKRTCRIGGLTSRFEIPLLVCQGRCQRAALLCTYKALPHPITSIVKPVTCVTHQTLIVFVSATGRTPTPPGQAHGLTLTGIAERPPTTRKSCPKGSHPAFAVTSGLYL